MDKSSKGLFGANFKTQLALRRFPPLESQNCVHDESFSASYRSGFVAVVSGRVVHLQFVPRSFAFVISTHESSPILASHSKRASASGVNVRSFFYAQTLHANSLHSGKRCCHCLHLPENENPRPQKQFTENSTRHPEVTAELPVEIGPSPDYTDIILHGQISPLRPSSAEADPCRGS